MKTKQRDYKLNRIVYGTIFICSIIWAVFLYNLIDFLTNLIFNK